MHNQVIIGKDLLERAAGHLPDVQVNSIALAPPDTIRVTADLNATILGRAIKVHPGAVIRIRASDGRIKFQAASVNLDGIPVPRILVDHQLNEIVQASEQEANQVVQQVFELTKMKLTAATCTGESLVLEFADDHF